MRDLKAIGFKQIEEVALTQGRTLTGRGAKVPWKVQEITLKLERLLNTIGFLKHRCEGEHVNV